MKLAIKKTVKFLLWAIAVCITLAFIVLAIAQNRLRNRVQNAVLAKPQCPELVLKALSCADPKRTDFRLLPSGSDVHLSRLLLREKFGTSRLPLWRVLASDMSVAWLLNAKERDLLACAIEPDGGGLNAYAVKVLGRPLSQATELQQVFVACAFDHHFQPGRTGLHYDMAKKWIDSLKNQEKKANPPNSGQF